MPEIPREEIIQALKGLAIYLITLIGLVALFRNGLHAPPKLALFWGTLIHLAVCVGLIVRAHRS